MTPEMYGLHVCYFGLVLNGSVQLDIPYLNTQVLSLYTNFCKILAWSIVEIFNPYCSTYASFLFRWPT